MFRLVLSPSDLLVTQENSKWEWPGEVETLRAGEPWVACNTCLLEHGKELLLAEGKPAYFLSPEKGKASSKKEGSARAVTSRELSAARGWWNPSSTSAL